MKEHFCPAEKSTITYQGKCNWCGETEGSMNEIIEMAQQCGLIGMRPHLDGIYMESLIAFANLVAAKEREACAKVCETNVWSEDDAWRNQLTRAQRNELKQIEDGTWEADRNG